LYIPSTFSVFPLGCSPPSKPRILCYINTIPATYFTKTLHVKRTWACRCTKILFFSSKAEPSIPVIDLNLTKPESRMYLWSKMRKIVRYVFGYRDEFDYFYKADDDTYMFVENLVEELSWRNPDEPFMMGHRFPRFQKVGYFSGGAGYVLSRGALKLLVERAIDIHPNCPTYDEDKEDVKMSKSTAVFSIAHTYPLLPLRSVS
uniref:N-acetylgalactosaminide beta-1,3-galactosyltransferase n=1 Tax=Schistocephalus solidus TaxID=70667 RepID=A0A183SWW5_SCHSO